MINVRLKYLSDKISRPEYPTRGSVGMELAAAIDDAFVLKAGQRASIPTGIAIQIPLGYGGFIYSLDALAEKKGIVVCSGTGVIDNDFIDEVKVLIENTSDEDYTIKTDEKIAKMVFKPVETANLVITDGFGKK